MQKTMIMKSKRAADRILHASAVETKGIEFQPYKGKPGEPNILSREIAEQAVCWAEEDARDRAIKALCGGYCGAEACRGVPNKNIHCQTKRKFLNHYDSEE